MIKADSFYPVLCSSSLNLLVGNWIMELPVPLERLENFNTGYSDLGSDWVFFCVNHQAAAFRPPLVHDLASVPRSNWRNQME